MVGFYFRRFVGLVLGLFPFARAGSERRYEGHDPLGVGFGGAAVDDDAEIVLGALRGASFDQGRFGVGVLVVDAEDFGEERPEVRAERIDALCFV